jgi:hypothetical protein
VLFGVVRGVIPALGAAALAQNWVLFCVFMGAGLAWAGVLLGFVSLQFRIGCCLAFSRVWPLLNGFAPAFVAVWLAVCVAGLWAGPGLGLGWAGLDGSPLSPLAMHMQPARADF